MHYTPWAHTRFWIILRLVARDHYHNRSQIQYTGDLFVDFLDQLNFVIKIDHHVYRKKYDDIQRLDRILGAVDDTPNRYKASKQVDVLLLFHFLSAEELVEIFEQVAGLSP